MINTASPHYRKIKKLVGKAIGDFRLVEEGDRVLVGVSGGKDSYTLLHILEALRRRAPVRYELVPVNLHPGTPEYRQDIIADHLRDCGFTPHLEQTEAYSIIQEKRRPGTSYGSFCARLRRGALYGLADRFECNKIALGHHLDDVIETLLLNQFFVGTLAAMSPKLKADNERHTVIRPLVYVEESEIIAFAKENSLPIVPCTCPGCDDQDQQRQRMKALIATLAKDIPQIRHSLLAATGNVQPRHLLDPSLQPF